MMPDTAPRFCAIAAAIACVWPISSAAAAQETKAFTIVTFGTSLTARGGWQQPLQEALAECMSQPVKVETVARSGATSEWAVTMIDSVVELKPDVVLVEFYANDASIRRHVGLGRSGRNIETVLGAFRQRLPKARVIVMAMNPMHGLRGWMRPFLDSYVEEHRRIALDTAYEFLDNRPAWNRLTSGEISEAIPDGVHPQQKMASTVMVPGLAMKIAGNCKA